MTHLRDVLALGAQHQRFPVGIFLERVRTHAQVFYVLQLEHARDARLARVRALRTLLEVQQKRVCLLLLHLPEPLLSGETQRFVAPRQNTVGQDLVDADVCTEIECPRQHLRDGRLAREGDDANDLGRHVLYPAGENFVTALQRRRKFGLDDGNALVAQLLHAIFRADAQDPSDECYESR